MNHNTLETSKYLQKNATVNIGAINDSRRAHIPTDMVNTNTQTSLHVIIEENSH